jgi:hypothetical protein
MQIITTQVLLFCLLLQSLGPSWATAASAQASKDNYENEDRKTLTSLCNQVNFVSFQNIKSEGKLYIQRFIRVVDKSKPAAKLTSSDVEYVNCGVFGFTPIEVTKQVSEVFSNEETFMDQCRTEKDALKIAALLNMKSDVDSITDRISCKKEEIQTPAKCTGEFACGMTDAVATASFIPKVARDQLKETLGIDKNSCSASDTMKGLGSCAMTFLKGIFQSVKGLWDLGKSSLKWVKEKSGKTWDRFFGNPVVQEDQNRSSEAAMVLGNQKPKDVDGFKSNPGAWIKKFFQGISTMITDSIKTNFGCAKWESVPHVSKCMEPLPSLECASCRQQTQMVCGVVGYLASEGFLITAITIGTAGLGAAVVAKLAAQIGSKFSLSKKGAMALQGVGKASIAAKFIKTPASLVVSGVGGVVKVAGSTLKLIRSVPGISHASKAIRFTTKDYIAVNESIARVSWNASYHGTKGLIEGGAKGALTAYRTAEAASALVKFNYAKDALAFARQGGNELEIQKAEKLFNQAALNYEKEAMKQLEATSVTASKTEDLTIAPAVPKSADEIVNAYPESFRSIQVALPGISSKEMQKMLVQIREAFNGKVSDSEIAYLMEKFALEGATNTKSVMKRFTELKNIKATYPDFFDRKSVLNTAFKEDGDLTKLAYIDEIVRNGVPLRDAQGLMILDAKENVVRKSISKLSQKERNTMITKEIQTAADLSNCKIP